jgi:hypothetical protein
MLGIALNIAPNIRSMSSYLSESPKILVRPAQYRDLEAIEAIAADAAEVQRSCDCANPVASVQQLRRWYGALKFFSLFPNPLQDRFRVYVAEQELANSRERKLLGLIQVSPLNKTRSTWRVERVLVEQNPTSELFVDLKEVGSQLLRYCFESIWEARTWVLEVNVNEQGALALYRQNGFQPLAQLTYWSLTPKLLEELAKNDSELPNLLPASNADAQLLCQLDCVSMPPLLRQVFDRHVQDFKSNLVNTLLKKFNQWCSKSEMISGYVFEPQRKAAIGYFKLNLHKDGSQPHEAQLTVHPAYTWLYPKLLAKMAQSVTNLPSQSLELVSADYQHEREEYLEQLGTQRIEHTLLMSRSVWHKLKETKPEGLQLSEMLQGLHPVPRTPIPSRISWQKSSFKASNLENSEINSKNLSKNGKNIGESSQNSDLNPDG